MIARVLIAALLAGLVAGILPVVVMAPCSFTSSTPGGTLVQFVALVAPKISNMPVGLVSEM